MPKLISRRGLVGGMLTAVVGGSAISGISELTAADAAATAAKGQVTLESLGNLISALGLKATKTDSRYDFQFASTQGEEWELSMSVVLSNDQKSLWLMAWLDELPQASQDIPRSALLRLLSDNDKMGSGQFFAYVSSNRRFVLQRVMANENITSASFREAVVDLRKTVVNTYPHWTVQNWKQPASGAADKIASGSQGDGSELGKKEKELIPSSGGTKNGGAPASTRTATKETGTSKK